MRPARAVQEHIPECHESQVAAPSFRQDRSSHGKDRAVGGRVRWCVHALIGVIALAGNAVAQDYPRLANLYLHGSVDPRVIPDLARWDLLVLNAVWSQSELAQLRRLNPDIKIFLYVCAYCAEASPNRQDAWGQQNASYAAVNDLWWYNRNATVASDWPGSRMVNITAHGPRASKGTWREYIAERIELLLQERPAADGVFLDNYWRSISWNQGALQLDSDCNPTHNPAGCDGVMDDNETLDALWNAALRSLAADLRARFDALEAGRERPLALFSNSATDYHTWLNGTLWEFFPEGRSRGDPGNVHGYDWVGPMLGVNGYLQAPFSSDPYRALVLNAVVDGTRAGPSRTADFERHKRFTLVSALLGDGYYSLDAGLTLGHGQMWWEPEYDDAGRGTGYLGKPTSAPYRVVSPTGPEHVSNGDFSSGQAGWLTLDQGAAGSLTIDTYTFHSAPASARIDVRRVDRAGHLKLWQPGLKLRADTPYTLSFWARSTPPQAVLLHVYSGACTNKRCMQDTYVNVGLWWQKYTMSFDASSSAMAGLNVFVSQVGSVWLDDVTLRQGDANVFRRDFEKGTVLLNYASTPQSVNLQQPYRRLAIPGSPVFDGATVVRETVPPSDARILILALEDPAPEPPPGADGVLLRQNEPNPFNPSTRIRFSLEQTSLVEIEIFSAAGQRVRTLVDDVLAGGLEHEVVWDGKNDLQQPVASGVYFFKLRTPAYSDLRKMTLIR